MKKEKLYSSLNRAYFSEDVHEQDILNHLSFVFKSVKIFVDIGSSIGQYTLFANENMSDGEIYTIEADPVRFEELERNCLKWESLSNNKLTPIHAAASDTDGKISFFTTNSSISGGLFKRSISNNNIIYDEVDVKSLKLDTLFQNNMRPDFVKIDVEGSELRVLKGARQILWEGKAKFLVEVHNWADPEGQKDAEDVYQFMKSFGYGNIKFFKRNLFVKKGVLFYKYQLTVYYYKFIKLFKWLKHKFVITQK